MEIDKGIPEEKLHLTVFVDKARQCTDRHISPFRHRLVSLLSWGKNPDMALY